MFLRILKRNSRSGGNLTCSPDQIFYKRSIERLNFELPHSFMSLAQISQGVSVNNKNPVIVYQPDWGNETWRFWDVVNSARTGFLKDTVEALLGDICIEEKSQKDCSKIFDLKKAQYSLSLLSDLIRAGVEFWVRDSRLYFRWPDWSSKDGRLQAQAAMMAAKELKPIDKDRVTNVKQLFAPSLDGYELSTVMNEALFELVPVSDSHPSGQSYQEAFGIALRYWSMPYRGRTGRMRRFVLTAKHKLLGAFSVIAGLLELGDEAPFCQWRDDLLGLSHKSFLSWIQTLDKKKVSFIADRFLSFRGLIRPTSCGYNVARFKAEELVEKASTLEKASSGRSKVLNKEQDLLKDRKRIAYGLRLAKGEFAVSRFLKGSSISDLGSMFYEGVRGVHDLMIPRVHLEATVCGAVPPFSSGLAGKLMVAFLSHPFIIKSPLGSKSELLDWSFNYESLSPLLPSEGMLCLTTKGLYANHAAIYNRAEMPSKAGTVRFRHLANTDGATTTLISDRTTRFAKALIDNMSNENTKVSRLYGSGGAKRHRFIESATTICGLSTKAAFAGIPRPVYGTLFVENPNSVCWLNEKPDWIVDPNIGSSAFNERASTVWRKKWLFRSNEKLRDYAHIPTLPDYFLKG
jgi:hypothetical protein